MLFVLRLSVFRRSCCQLLVSANCSTSPPRLCCACFLVRVGAMTTMTTTGLRTGVHHHECLELPSRSSTDVALSTGSSSLRSSARVSSYLYLALYSCKSKAGRTGKPSITAPSRSLLLALVTSSLDMAAKVSDRHKTCTEIIKELRNNKKF